MNYPAFYFVLFFAGIVVQFAVSQYLAIAGVSPNFMLLLLIYIGLRKGSMTGQIFGFLWGLSWDALSYDLFGSHALLFTCIGYLSGQLSRKWNESKMANQMLLAFAASAFFIFGMYLLYQVFGSGEFKFRLNHIKVLQPVYNMLLAPLVFWGWELLSRGVKKEQRHY